MRKIYISALFKIYGIRTHGQELFGENFAVDQQGSLSGTKYQLR